MHCRSVSRSRSSSPDSSLPRCCKRIAISHALPSRRSPQVKPSRAASSRSLYRLPMPAPRDEVSSSRPGIARSASISRQAQRTSCNCPRMRGAEDASHSVALRYRPTFHSGCGAVGHTCISPSPASYIRRPRHRRRRCHRSASAAEAELAGLRDYQLGDALNRIAWKAVARGAGWYSKQFEGAGGRGLVELDWADLPPALDDELRLSRLTAWILAAEREARAFALRLPGIALPLGQGAVHRRRALAALALFPEHGS